tara:strand:+ start:14730 stop:15677 length:948 start_codon:yes stop_codon:yes gene_type:complete
MRKKKKVKLYTITAVIAVVILVGLGALAFKYVKGFELNLLEELRGSKELIEHRFNLLEENIAQSSTQSLDQDELLNLLGKISENNYLILERFEDLEIEPTVITRTTGTVEGEVVTLYVETLADIPREFIFSTEAGMPLAYYTITTDEDGSYEMETGTYTLTVVINNVSGYSEAHAPLVITEALISSSGGDEEYPINIQSSATWHAIESPVEFHWLDPQLEIGAFTGYNPFSLEAAFGGDLGMTLMSYGTGDRDILRVIRAGIGTDGSSIGITASPIGFNIGEPLPVVEDLWIYPSVYMEIGNWKPAIVLGLSSTL